MSSENAISVQSLGKSYHIYDKPRDRLLQMFFRNGRKLYRDFWALQDVSFEVKRGETVGIIGRNGSGKSTLLQIICGTLNPSSGQVAAHGRIAALLELGAGFNPEFTGRENVYISATLYGLTRAQVDERLNDIMEFADIGEFIDQPVKAYSSGMFVRLAFAVIAHVDADVLIVDEALAVGDAFFTQRCMRFLRDFMRTGTVLFVSHDTAAVKALCSRAVWLQNGKVVATGPAKQVCDAYLGEMIEAGQSTNGPPRHGSTAAHQSNEKIEVAEVCADSVAPVVDENLGDERIYFLPFNRSSGSFGAGGASIVGARFLDGNGEQLSSIEPYKMVMLKIDLRAIQPLRSPIVGFFVRDRLGQTLFGSNTSAGAAAQPLAIAADLDFDAIFAFHFPALPNGDYTISMSVADGVLEDHVQLHWLHDAMGIKSQGIADLSGMVGVAMAGVQLNILDEDAAAATPQD